jgi:HlyD family secretion protein
MNKKIISSKVYARPLAFVKKYTKTSIALVLIVILGLYFGIKSLTSTTGEPSYVLGTVERGTVVASITGSGQVSADRQIELKPKVSGDVVYVAVHAGDTLASGALIASLDATDAQKAVRDAEVNLASAKISLTKLQQPADSLSLLQAQNALAQAEADLSKSYEDGFNTVSATFLDMPATIAGVDTVLHGTDASGGNSQQNISYYTDTASQFESPSNFGHASTYKTQAEDAYQKAKTAYDKNFNDYKNATRGGDTTATNALIEETSTTAKLISEAVKNASNLIQYYQDTLTTLNRTPSAKSTTHISTLSGYTSKINTEVANLLATKTSITNANYSVPEKQESLQKLKSGADTLDVQSSQLSITARENALRDAQDNLNNYYIRAPFGGTLAKLNVARGDSAGSGTAIGTFIANEQVADISLNEVDAAKVKVGQKVTLTFDAIDGLTLTGKVAQVDTLGTVTQGVVTYTITISFDSTDPRVKSGMSVSASIITDVKPDVLMVPNSAIKSSGDTHYVEVFSPALTSTAGTTGTPSTIPPARKQVEIGIASDSDSEIISGLSEGDQIVTRTITGTTTTQTASAPSLLGGNTRGGGAGAIRSVAR